MTMKMSRKCRSCKDNLFPMMVIYIAYLQVKGSVQLIRGGVVMRIQNMSSWSWLGSH